MRNHQPVMRVIILASTVMMYQNLWNIWISVACCAEPCSFWPTWPQTSRCPFTTKSHVKGNNCVKWSRYTTLKFSNKHQVKVLAHFIFFPVCKYSVLVYPTGFDFFHTQNYDSHDGLVVSHLDLSRHFCTGLPQASVPFFFVFVCVWCCDFKCLCVCL